MKNPLETRHPHSRSCCSRSAPLRSSWSPPGSRPGSGSSSSSPCRRRRSGRSAAGCAQRPPRRTWSGDVGPIRRILVVANETVGGERAAATSSAAKAEGVSEDVLLVCPALNSRLRTWTSDEDGARAAAQHGSTRASRGSPSSACSARGEIGDGDPLQALEDALRDVPGRRDRDLDPPAGPLALARAGRRRGGARSRYDVPVTHVVVDLEIAVGRRRCADYLPATSRRTPRPPAICSSLSCALERRHAALAVRDPVDRELRATASRRRGSGRRCRPSPAVGERVTAAAAGRREDRLRRQCRHRRAASAVGGFAGSIGFPLASRPATEAT